jgi:hypothetical protein
MAMSLSTNNGTTWLDNWVNGMQYDDDEKRRGDLANDYPLLTEEQITPYMSKCMEPLMELNKGLFANVQDVMIDEFKYIRRMVNFMADMGNVHIIADQKRQHTPSSVTWFKQNGDKIFVNFIIQKTEVLADIYNAVYDSILNHESIIIANIKPHVSEYNAITARATKVEYLFAMASIPK